MGPGLLDGLLLLFLHQLFALLDDGFRPAAAAHLDVLGLLQAEGDATHAEGADAKRQAWQAGDQANDADEDGGDGEGLGLGEDLGGEVLPKIGALFF